MADAAHTPGPWSVRTDLLTNGHLAVLAGSYGVAKVWDLEPGKSDENAANARLIAAAPDYHAAAWGTDPEMPDQIRPVSWLRGMIAACKQDGVFEATGDDDPDAWWEMVRECESLLAGLERAAAKAEGR